MWKRFWKLSDMAGRLWCGVMHDGMMWPVHGRYRCRTCWREYVVAWEGNGVRLRTEPGIDPITANEETGNVRRTPAACPA